MKKYWSLIVIVIFGIFLRFYHNLDISLWHDEAFSALMIRYGWSEMFYRLGLDVHPPMYYIFLRLWHYVFGDSLLSLRGMSIFFGTGTIWAAWAFTKEAFKNEKAALWAALLVAINPFQLQYVTEARMYTMGAFFALLAGYFLVKALGEQKELHRQEVMHMPNLPADTKLRRKMNLSWVGFTGSMVIIIYTHYYLFFTAAALGAYAVLYLLLHHKWDYKKYWRLVVSFAVIVASFLPWLKTFLFQYRQVNAGYWIGPMNRWSIPSTLWDMLLGLARDINNPTTQVWLIIITLIVIGIFIRFLRKTESFHKWLVVMCVAAPFGGAILFALMAKLKGSNSSVYLDRYFLFASIYFSIAVAVWLKEIKQKWLSAGLFVAYVIFNLFTFAHYWGQLDILSRPGMAAAQKLLEANVEPNHHIFVGTSFEFFNLKYYLTQKSGSSSVIDGNTGYHFINNVRPLLYTGGRSDIKQISHVEGVALLTNEDLVPDFTKAVKSGDTVWVVWTYAFGSNRPDLPKNWVQIDEREFPDVRPYVGTTVYVSEYRVN